RRAGPSCVTIRDRPRARLLLRRMLGRTERLPTERAMAGARLLHEQLVDELGPEDANAVELSAVRDHRREPREIVRRREEARVAGRNAELVRRGIRRLPTVGNA